MVFSRSPDSRPPGMNIAEGRRSIRAPGSSLICRIVSGIRQDMASSQQLARKPVPDPATRRWTLGTFFIGVFIADCRRKAVGPFALCDQFLVLRAEIGNVVIQPFQMLVATGSQDADTLVIFFAQRSTGLNIVR